DRTGRRQRVRPGPRGRLRLRSGPGRPARPSRVDHWQDGAQRGHGGGAQHARRRHGSGADDGPEPAMTEPAMPGPAMPGPAMPGPAAPGPAAPGPAMRDPTRERVPVYLVA